MPRAQRAVRTRRVHPGPCAGGRATASLPFNSLWVLKHASKDAHVQKVSGSSEGAGVAIWRLLDAAQLRKEGGATADVRAATHAWQARQWARDGRQPLSGAFCATVLNRDDPSNRCHLSLCPRICRRACSLAKLRAVQQGGMHATCIRVHTGRHPPGCRQSWCARRRPWARRPAGRARPRTECWRPRLAPPPVRPASPAGVHKHPPPGQLQAESSVPSWPSCRCWQARWLLQPQPKRVLQGRVSALPAARQSPPCCCSCQWPQTRQPARGERRGGSSSLSHPHRRVASEGVCCTMGAAGVRLAHNYRKR